MLIKILVSAFTLAALILLIVTISLIKSRKQKLNSSKKCEGTIVDVKTEYRHGERHVYPIVSYNIDGIDYKFNGSYCSTSMKVGDKVSVLYDIYDYRKAWMEKGLALAPMITGILAVAFTVASVICWILIVTNTASLIG